MIGPGDPAYDPVLLGLFSLVTLFAYQLLQGQDLPVRQAAWYTWSSA